MTRADWRNITDCMCERAFGNMPSGEIVSDKDKQTYNECVETLAASYILMDFYHEN